MSNLTKIERVALLKVRYAGRYDNLGKNDTRATEEEASEEQQASRVSCPGEVYEALLMRGLVWRDGGRYRLTDAGHASLKREYTIVNGRRHRLMKSNG